ncbi:VacJ family lipoprotein [Massilia sp. Dwa41.01b]|uniref:MlaA family lipoprotein n=1 Tax=Massilia sp. Dwa41.01b TaxID=2709302 RepID=UPI0016010909|nr:VacJ family lipoprotein [Massilia sp. Dwa41.01b]QNA87377.1 VacJ family lipoprotein [Massilia sp. Dwa41.01b]
MNSNNMNTPRWRGLALALAAGALLAGCASPNNPRDPLEKFNRATFAFNDTVDRVALKPAATAYKKVLPGFVQTGVGNFFGNLSDAWSGVNNLLQGKGEAGMTDLTRFTLNSTFGIAGILDIASEAGLQKHNEDFGQTLGVWGVPSGPYLMLPLLGPSTIRDTAALPADMWADPWSHKTPVNWRNVGTGVRAVDQRASVLEASNLFEEAALDRYEFIRDGYLQRRESRVFDGDSERADEAKDARDATQAKDDAAADAADAAKAAASDSPASNTQVTPEPASTETETQRK